MRHRVGTGGSTVGTTGRPYSAGELEVALVLRRAAEDRPGAVGREHEVGDVDRQVGRGPQGMAAAQAGVEALFSAVSISSSEVPIRKQSSTKAASSGFGGKLARERVIGAIAMNEAPTACRAGW